MTDLSVAGMGDYQVSVLFVCLGNICRSPTAHGLFRNLVAKRGYASSIYIDSAGTGDWHIGRPPDQRATAKAAERAIDLSDLRARQVTAADFDQFDYILAMDSQNLSNLKTMCPSGFSKYLGLFLEFADEFSEQEVPDPYYGGDQGFELVLDMVQNGCEGLLADICQKYKL